MSGKRTKSRCNEFYLVTTDNLKEGLWFRNDSDYKAGMNYVAVTSFVCGVIVLAFVLMSNHVHFVLQCTREEALSFINAFKEACSRYIFKRYGVKELLRRNGVDIQRICLDDESFERGVAYVQMNPPAANLCLYPTAYPWGTGGVFFQVRPRKGTRLGSLSKRAARRLLHSNQVLPADWLVGEDGYIIPESYVPVAQVESLFRTPKRMDYFLRNSSKAKRRREFGSNEVPAFSDQTVCSALPDLYRFLGGGFHVSDLDREQRTELVRQLRRCFYSDVHQIARVTTLPLEDVVRCLDAP